MKEAKQYVNEFSHITTMMDKVKKPSTETLNMANLLGILLSSKFKQTESMIDEWEDMRQFMRAYSG